MTAITGMNLTTVRALQARMLAALKPLEAEFGITFGLEGASFLEARATMKLVATVNASDGSAVTSGEIEFKRYASRYGFAPSDFGREFRVLGSAKRYTIAGIKPSATRYPILGKDTNDRVFKFPVTMVLAGLTQVAVAPAASLPPTTLKAPAASAAPIGSRLFEDRLFG